jgi:predicted transcriptional regulator
MNDKTTTPKYKRRSSAQIMICLLDYLDEHKKVKKTWLLNESRMNSRTFEPHFQRLLDKHFIESDIEGNFFELTPTGRFYLLNLRQVDRFDSTTYQYEFKTNTGMFDTGLAAQINYIKSL